MNGRYILDENNHPIEVEDLHVWASFMQGHEKNRQIAKDELPGGVRVSTVFLGLDHSFGEVGLPVLWETMIFGGPNDQYQERYTSHEAALEGHARALKLAVELEPAP